MNRDETIAAISTPPGTGAISIVRVSGPLSFQIMEKIFSCEPPLAAGVDFDRRALHGFINDPSTGECVDEVVLIPYRGPITYTGEDLLEINCHGSPLLTRQILDLCVENGARLAERGEFTKRSFLAGRLDLTQAEAVLDLIQAKTTRQGRLTISTLKGQLGERIKQIRQSLLELLSGIVAGIDFPEEIGEIPAVDIQSIIREMRSDMEKLAATARSGRFLREGLKIAIIGRPNVGKSSLLNRLLQFDRAIVTSIPGTTRDCIEEPLDLNGVPIVLIDTAGVRSTHDEVEKIGIDRTTRAIGESDLVLVIYDLSQGWNEDDQQIMSLAVDVPAILVGNKVDLLTPMATHQSHRLAHESSQNSSGETAIATAASSATLVEEERTPGDSVIDRINISAMTGEGIEALSHCIEKWALADESIKEAGGSLNQRQGALCNKAIQALELVEQAVQDGLPQDCLATDLRIAIDCLSEVCGDEVSEELISEVFSRFCIGK